MVSKKKSLKSQLIKDKILFIFSSGDKGKIPSERELCELFKVSRTTVRRALGELEKSKHISRKVGKGTFIISKRRSQLIWFLCVGTPPQLLSFFEREIKLFMSERNDADIRLLHIDARRLADEIRVRAGVKIILAPNFGYLIATRMLFPLNQIEDFTDCLSYINSNYIEWHNSPKERKECYFIPLFVDAEVLAVNVKLADELGLSLPPRNWNDIINWLNRVEKEKLSGRNIKGGLLPNIGRNAVNPPPITYYISASRGKNFIINECGNTKFDFSAGNQWLDFFKRCHQSGGIFYETDCSEISPLFGNNILFGFKVGSWIVQQKRLFPSCPLELIFIPSPSGIEGNYSLISLLGMGIINDGFINRDNLRIAWNFIKKLVCSVDVQRKLINNYFGISINTEVFSEQKSKKEYIPFIQSLSMGTIRSDHPAQHGILKVMRVYFDKAIKGELSINDVCLQIQEIGELQIEIENDRFLV